MPNKLKLFSIVFILLTIGLSLFAIFKQHRTNDRIDVSVPLPGINAHNLIVLYKRSDPLSEQIARQYQHARHIPDKHVIGITLPDTAEISPSAFQSISHSLKTKLPPEAQGLLVTWNAPYRVGRMSITSALAFGYDPRWTQPPITPFRCRQTQNSPYFNHSTRSPRTDLNILPAFMLSGNSLKEAEDVIQKGLASDGTQPLAKVVLVRTSDTQRSSRWPIFKKLAEATDFHPGIDIFFLDASDLDSPNFIEKEQGLLLYETGLAKVPKLDTLEFLPGAVGDHLTSFGGTGINNHGQMSAFEWLRRGTTASYGTVVEPCNYPQKFPNPAVFLSYYLNGETLMEAYWKSVQQPGEGLFIGDPLARPYDRLHTSLLGGHLKIVTNRLNRYKRYALEQWKGGIFVRVNARFNWQTETLVTIRANRVEGTRFRIRSLDNTELKPEVKPPQ